MKRYLNFILIIFALLWAGCTTTIDSDLSDNNVDPQVEETDLDGDIISLKNEFSRLRQNIGELTGGIAGGSMGEPSH